MKSVFRLFLLIISCVLFLNSPAFSQAPYSKGDKIGSIGIGFGFAGIYGDASVPPISLGFQYGLEDKISIGGIIGYTSSSYKYNFGGDYEWKYSYIVIGARGEYHFLENVDKMDGYAGATLGYNIVSVSEPTVNTAYGTFGGYSSQGSYALFGVHVGLRYYFDPKIAVFGELGYGIGYITVGASFKL